MKIKKNTKLISEKNLVDRFVQLINEAPPMSFDPELGGARPSKSIQSKIEKGEMPLSKFGLTQAQVDFFTSQAFKDSVLNLERLMDRNTNVTSGLVRGNQNLKRDAQTAFRELYMLVNEILGELITLQSQNKEELEEIANESVEKAMGIDREFFSKKLKLDGEFTSGFLSKLKGMKEKVKNISDEEIMEKFSEIDKEKQEQLEQMRQEFESEGMEFDEEQAKKAINTSYKISKETADKAKQSFSDEVSRRMIVNLFRRGMALYYANAYEICKDKIEELPDGERIIELSNVIQPIMLHMYWLFPDIGSIGTSGGGQIGQIEVLPPNSEGFSSNKNDDDEDEEEEETPQPQQQPQQTSQPSGPFTIRARAMTLPLLVHELVKGVVMFFTSAGGENSEKGRLAKQQASSLEIEAYDLVYGEKFYVEFYKIFNNIVSDSQEQRDLTPFMLKFISEEKYDTLVKLAQSLFTLGLSDPEFAENYVSSLVEKSRKLRKQMERNPSYMSKKKYGQEKDDADFDDFLNDLDL